MTSDSTPVWFITGCSTGFGRELAKLVLDHGWRAVVTARDTSRVQDLLSGREDRALALVLDVTDAGQVKDSVKAAEERFGAIDVLVNNAGYGYQAPVEEGDDAEIRAMFEANVFGLAAMIRAVLPGMRARRRGHIVNISSVAGRFANFGSAVYNLTKFGVNAFSEALRQEVAAANVKVTVIEPGFVATELQGHNTHPMVLDAIENMRKEIGEPLEASDIAEAILYSVGGPERVAVNEVLVRPAGQRR
jgi:NADP-dependent 3-hydroxy acid dehydrogenase YdfG